MLYNSSILVWCKSNRCYDWQLKVVQKSLKKGDYNFSYDGTPDWEKESTVNKKIYHIEFKICSLAGNGSHVVIPRQIFYFSYWSGALHIMNDTFQILGWGWNCRSKSSLHHIFVAKIFNYWHRSNIFRILTWF